MVSVRIQVRSARSAIAAQQLQIFVRQRPAYPNGSSQTYIEHRWSQGGSDAGDVLAASYAGSEWPLLIGYVLGRSRQAV